MTLLELFTLLRKHLKLVIAVPVLCAVVMAVASVLFMGDTYTASTSMYVLSSSANESSSTLSSDLSAGQMLSNDVSTLLTSDRVKNDTAAQLGLDDLDDYEISVNSETTTRVISLEVTGPDPQTAADIANGLVANVSQIAQQVMNVESVNPIDEAKAPENPSGPQRLLYIAVAFCAGLFIAVAIVVLADMLNTTVRNGEEVEELLGVSVIGRIPRMKGGDL